MTWFALVVFLVGVNCIQKELTNGCPEVKVVQNFNLSAYSGKWHEQLKYPNPHEINGKCITAEYVLHDDGSIGIINTMKNNRTNATESIEGSAKLDSQIGEGKILVLFKVTVAEAPYWVLDTDYTNYSVVWNCWNPFQRGVRKYAWIITRTPNPPEDVLKEAVDGLKKQNIDTNLLTKTDQENCD